MKMQPQSVVEYVALYAAENPQKTAVIANGKETTYAELWSDAQRKCCVLKNKGCKKGGVVVLRASQTLEYVSTYLAIHLAGGVVASLENGLSDQSVDDIAQKLNAQIIIKDSLGDSEKTNREQKIAFPQGDDSADILFTTGTTGASKGVELSHKSLVTTARNIIAGCGYKSDTVIVVQGPLNHANGIRKVITTFVNGSTIYILDGMKNIKEFFAALDYPKGAVACCLPPSAIRTLFILAKNKLASYADRIDFIESGTAPLPEPDKERLRELLPRSRLYNYYGSSEAGAICVYDYNKYPGKRNCVGKPMPESKVFIVDENRAEIESSQNKTGFVACAGNAVMKRYVNEPSLTEQVLGTSVRGGVLYSSDLGYIDSEGFVYVVGRQGDVINVGGLKVQPTEVESAALSFEGVDDCICVPVDDKITGKALKLFVVPRQETVLDKKALREFLLSKLEAYKVPRHYEETDAIKRTYNGKLNRKAYL